MCVLILYIKRFIYICHCCVVVLPVERIGLYALCK